MDKKIFVIIFAVFVTASHGFGLRDIWDFLIGAGYGYPNNGAGYPNYPSGPGLYPGGDYQGNYPGGNYPGSHYPGNHVAGPPGAHPGCPLCDSSVYSYCSHKQAHDSCCCESQACFGLRDIWDFLIGAGYGYPNNGAGYPNYPSGPGLYPGGDYQGNYPGGNYPGSHYPGNHVAGPPGAHPGCPLCDSSVYSYCSHKQAHDSCCCESQAYQSYNCRKSDCRYLHANSCQEYNLISSCCCIDLQKNSIEPVVPVVG